MQVWTFAVGPNKSIDTNKYFIICANVLGGCMGSFGPSHENPKTKKIYGTDFPVITINAMVNAQLNLLDHFGIKKLFSVVGGSMGGMQLLQFCATFPDKTLISPFVTLMPLLAVTIPITSTTTTTTTTIKPQ